MVAGTRAINVSRIISATALRMYRRRLTRGASGSLTGRTEFTSVTMKTTISHRSKKGERLEWLKQR